MLPSLQLGATHTYVGLHLSDERRLPGSQPLSWFARKTGIEYRLEFLVGTHVRPDVGQVLQVERWVPLGCLPCARTNEFEPVRDSSARLTVTAPVPFRDMRVRRSETCYWTNSVNLERGQRAFQAKCGRITSAHSGASRCPGNGCGRRSLGDSHAQRSARYSASSSLPGLRRLSRRRTLVRWRRRDRLAARSGPGSVPIANCHKVGVRQAATAGIPTRVVRAA